MRIAVKKLRYAVETFAPCLGPSLEEVYPALKSIQDALGEVHDRDVFVAAVRDAGLLGDAAGAGVVPAGIEAVVRDLRSERSRQFRAFEALIEQWTVQRLSAALTVVDARPVAGDGTP
jgi:CHAD domain-containing protein